MSAERRGHWDLVRSIGLLRFGLLALSIYLAWGSVDRYRWTSEWLAATRSQVPRDAEDAAHLARSVEMQSGTVRTTEWSIVLGAGLLVFNFAWLASTVWLHLRATRQAARRAAGRCPACGYDLRASPDRCPESGRCPACGYDLRASPDRCPECGRAPSAAARLT